MKKNYVLAGAAIFMAAIFAAPGCNKTGECPQQHFGEEIDACKVQRLVIDGDSSLNASFTYNTHGDPVSIIQGSRQLFMPLDAYFRYDNKHRLTDYASAFYHMQGAMTWHRYSYPAANLIVDTQFNYVGDVAAAEPPHSASSYYVYHHTLDQYGRIINTKDLFANSETSFTYDLRGNLVRPGVSYDDKLNPYHTSNTWMLIYRDYSLNNPLVSGAAISVYNKYGLPVKYTATQSDPGIFLFGYRYNASIVFTYGCDIGKWQAVQ